MKTGDHMVVNGRSDGGYVGGVCDADLGDRMDFHGYVGGKVHIVMGRDGRNGGTEIQSKHYNEHMVDITEAKKLHNDSIDIHH